MKSSLQNFFRSKRTYTSKVPQDVLQVVIRKWSLERMVRIITTDSAEDMIEGTELLRKELHAYTCSDKYKP